ncbi:MAG: hypothetical protein A3A29_00115 [Candidatus Ryanbacteria bacterium RIFCSPLOWO2_01_FULL_47_79]|uniref:DUF3467 domain-containing protein n=2 Tax=Parcubacteria group TaxID=1794811 RepID=A0A1G2H3M4_9BACT|nr:MAG: hypothetical protein A3A29_00115 [Candidatus Ryanbacteria bacterium RIFCSPLOWO2_01_FULL_47_79]OGZ57057.1 MAG: hypothetical protein A3J04_01820 [Candidatus Ryanbacteria bacterium RIFCSPLOWO2_02_FULL_47_14]OHA29579.1 MAG: hypothetical protein A3F51_02190 [Candidatus Taylorbacteria bacterium RIFCSPHIGHO2_12_FULL_45_16]HCJ52167.1 hypothetical protein [Candidatus Kerfeldbacteria bacterium]
MDINKIPKQFCDNVVVARSKESFTIGMLAGENGTFFALSPEHFKRLVQNLTHQLAEYEKEFEKIDAEWVPGVQSPFQTKDVMGGGEAPKT